MELEFSQTKMGYECVCLGGYVYTKFRTSKSGVITWMCTHKRKKCYSSIKTKDLEVLFVSNSHTCGDPDTTQLERRNAILNAKKRALTEDTPISEIYRQEVEKIENSIGDEKAIQKAAESTKRALRRHRELGRRNIQEAAQADSGIFTDSLTKIVKDAMNDLQNEDLIPCCSSKVAILDSSQFKEEIAQDILTEPENTSDDIAEAPPAVTPRDRLKLQTSNKWKSRNRPVMKRYKRSEEADLNELTQTRKELINLQIKQAKEKHAQEMQFMKLENEKKMENHQLKTEALKLEIQYYKTKLASLTSH